MNDSINRTDYSQFLEDIQSAIQSRHANAVYAVNRERMAVYQCQRLRAQEKNMSAHQ